MLVVQRNIAFCLIAKLHGFLPISAGCVNEEVAAYGKHEWNNQ